jgi:hypothetical protein
MTFPSFVDTSTFAVKSSHSVTTLWVVSFLSLAVNVAVLIYHFYKVVKHKYNPFKFEVYTDLTGYKRMENKNPLLWLICRGFHFAFLCNDIAFCVFK